MRLGLCLGLAVFLGAAIAADTQGPGRDPEEDRLRSNIGKPACNATNGAYRGRVVDVVRYQPTGQVAQWVFIVEREGRRTRVPPGNAVIAGTCVSEREPVEGSATAPDKSVSPALQGVATEFGRRLVAHRGQLIRLESQGSVIKGRWTSQRCDIVEGAVIDFLTSLHRGHPAPVTSAIEAEFDCGGSARSFRASAAMFQSYRWARNRGSGDTRRPR